MNMRFLSALVFSIIVAAELILFLNRPVSEKIVQTGERMEGQLFPPTESQVDIDAQNNANVRYAVLIGATILVGGLVTFALRNKKTA